MCDTESIPQIILQSVFVIRTYQLNNNEFEFELDTIDKIFVIISISLSILSATMKYSTRDQQIFRFDKCILDPIIWDFNENTNKWTCVSINYGYIARILWRFLNIVSRFTVFVLIWAICGGFYVLCSIVLSLIVYGILSKFFKVYDYTKLGSIIFWFIFYHFLSAAWQVGTNNTSSEAKKRVFHQFIENVIFLIIAWIFALVNFDFCDDIGGNSIFCIQWEIRNFDDNLFVAVYLVAGTFSTVVGTILFYCIPLIQRKVEKIENKIETKTKTMTRSTSS